jgi:hypothetical protein
MSSQFDANQASDHHLTGQSMPPSSKIMLSNEILSSPRDIPVIPVSRQ